MLYHTVVQMLVIRSAALVIITRCCVLRAAVLQTVQRLKSGLQSPLQTQRLNPPQYTTINTKHQHKYTKYHTHTHTTLTLNKTQHR